MFVHLHVHTEYSLLDGSAKVKDIVLRAKQLNMDALAITDHGVMFGAVDFYKAAKECGIKPIIGCEVYVSSGSRFDRNKKYFHLVLLAKDNEGYQNLMKLTSFGFTEGFYYKPRIDIELLKKYSSGLIALSACLAGPVARTLLNGTYEEAVKQALVYNEIFGSGNFYLELQSHGISAQEIVNKQLIKMSKELNIPLVCTNDVHYIKKEDSEPHEILLCIQTQKTINDSDRMKYEGQQFYLKSPEEMYELFSETAKEGLLNTVEIASRCNVEIEFGQYKMPKFIPPNSMSAYEYLRKLCFEGLNLRYGNKKGSIEFEQLIERMEYELSVILNIGFVDYFLIVWDFIKYAKDNGIMVGPGRGSAAGSIVSYCLKITNIDPVKYNLLFERFLNPDRISMPDIDIDFCYERRQEVIDYVIEKYGKDHVTQIITFGTMAARGSIRDVGRALSMSYGAVDRIAKMIPFALGMTIKKALEINVELAKAYKDEEEVKLLVDMAMCLEGLVRHASTHAAGVVICDKPVTEYVPLNVNDGVITTQFSMTTLEELGLLKMDFLGLRTLTVIQTAVNEINRTSSSKVNIDDIDFNDENVYKLISAAKTEGVFQLESSGMKSFMKELQPQCLEDIIAGISLFRPGPMDFIPKYIKGKRNPNNIRYTHELLEPILKSTYGCIVYQEQVMQIVRDLAGYSLSRSDLVRRAMSKKKADVMDEERRNFVLGCIERNISKQAADAIFDEMTDFAKYAFNKSHAAAYAVIGYQTAWLKVHYPVQFMAALMTSVMDSSEKIAEYINECKKMGIVVLPPDINESFEKFTVSNGRIRFGLLAIKNVGHNTIEALINERKQNGVYASLTHFISRLDTKELNKRCIESLIKAGAFDSLSGSRSQYMAMYKNILSGIVQTKKRTLEGQISLFEIESDNSGESIEYKDELPNVAEFSKKELLTFEKEMLGVYVSGHPLSEYEQFLNKYVDATTLDFANEQEKYSNKLVTVGGIIAAKSVKYTRDNKTMAFLTLEDLSGTMEIVIFPQLFEKYGHRLIEDEVIVVKGKVNVKEDEDAKVVCNEIIFRENTKPNANTENQKLWLKISSYDISVLNKIKDVAIKQPGNVPVIIYVEQTKQKISFDKKFWVSGDEKQVSEFKKLLGEGCTILK